MIEFPYDMSLTEHTLAWPRPFLRRLVGRVKGEGRGGEGRGRAKGEGREEERSGDSE